MATKQVTPGILNCDTREEALAEAAKYGLSKLAVRRNSLNAAMQWRVEIPAKQAINVDVIQQARRKVQDTGPRRARLHRALDKVLARDAAPTLIEKYKGFEIEKGDSGAVRVVGLGQRYAQYFNAWTEREAIEKAKRAIDKEVAKPAPGPVKPEDLIISLNDLPRRKAKDSATGWAALLAALYIWATRGKETVGPEDYDLTTYRPKRKSF